MEYKILVSIVAVILAMIGYGVYIRDILLKKTVPHAFTFLVWSMASGITWGLQAYGGAGAAAWITLAVTTICVVIFLLSLKYGDKEITRLDIIFLATSFVALALWLVADQPVHSIILLVTADVLGFVPTITKAWKRPFQETLFTWEITAFRHAFGILAIQNFNILTLLYPVVWTIVNVFFSMMLIIRRKAVKGNK